MDKKNKYDKVADFEFELITDLEVWIDYIQIGYILLIETKKLFACQSTVILAN